MKTVPHWEVQIAPNRQRREFNLAELNELGQSIAKNGLFHPIILREEAGGLWLVSGERRLRAIKDMHELGVGFFHDTELVPLDHIPYTTLGELDLLARKEAELEENLRRKDLTWQEQAAATAELAELRRLQAAASGNPPPSVRDLSLEVRPQANPEARGGRAHDDTRQELIVAQHLDDPEVKAAKSLNEAMKVLRRKEDIARRTLRAAEVGRSYSADTAHLVLNEDSTVWMVSAAAEQFDVICTDPPYGISADEFGDSGGHTAGPHLYKDDYEYWKTLLTFLAREGFRITKPQAHLYCFCDITRFAEAKEIFAAAGWKCFRTPIIWHKPNGNRLPWVDQGPQRKYELILYANKGNKLVTRIYADLVTYSADENQGHNAQKPVALYTDLLRRSVGPGDSVIDPFAGSGPVIPAANELKCRSVVIESDPAAYTLCTKRVDKLKEQPELEGLV